ILDFSKIEARKLQLDDKPFSLRESVADALDTLALPAHQKQLELSCRVDPEVPDQVVGDPHRLQQIVVNLVSNAIRFTEQGDVLVEIGLAGDEAKDPLSDKTVLLLHGRVRDTGIGIASDKHEMIFEAFAQADPSTTRRHGGTGLGLGIVSHLVRMMG